MKSIDRVVLFTATLMGMTFCAEGKATCDKLGINFYDNIGCAREHSEGECPSYSGCRYERDLGTCLYNGVVLRDHQSIGNEQDVLCNFGCFCSAPNNTKGTFVCAQGQCGYWGYPVQEGCYLQYKLKNCCGEQRCEPSQASCVVDDVTYKEGEKFYPKDECSVCICTSEFNGKYEGPHCKRRGCDAEIRHADKIEKNCAPTYYIADANAPLCCPQTFICPSDDDKFTGSADNHSALTCKYGNKTIKPGVRLTKEVEQYSKNRTVTCECKLPPLLTCTAEN